MQESTSLQALNLSDNNLNDAIAEATCEAVQKNSYLTELYLHWNNLGVEFVTTFLDGIKDNQSLKVLDLSWNQIGKGRKVLADSKYFPMPKKRRNRTPTASASICEFLKTNKSLFHFDLSSNHFWLEESQEIAEGLESNHSVYGFHFEGNYGYVDSEGFLQLDGATKEIKDYHTHKRIDSVKKLKFYNRMLVNEVDGGIQAKNCCWICDGWHEITFRFPDGKTTPLQ